MHGVTFSRSFPIFTSNIFENLLFFLKILPHIFALCFFFFIVDNFTVKTAKVSLLEVIEYMSFKIV